MSDPLWPRPTVTGQAPIREAAIRDTAEGVSVRHTPDHIQAKLFSYPDAYRDILRASAKFIRRVHATRWPQHT